MRVEKLLEGRKPWILIDEMIQYEPEQRIITRKFITNSDFFLIGHFPSYSVYPGMLLLEGLFQSAEVLCSLSQSNADLPHSGKRKPCFTSCNVRFLQPAEPGDIVEFTVKQRRSYAEDELEYNGIGVINGEIAIRADWRACTEHGNKRSFNRD